MQWFYYFIERLFSSTGALKQVTMQAKGVPAGKYNKVNQQKKFHLLSLIYKQKTPIREAAQQVGINYLTAKTIVFFHKNHCKSYQFDLAPLAPSPAQTASVALPRKLPSSPEDKIKWKSSIEVVCSIGSTPVPYVRPNTFPEGQITRQFASRQDGPLEAARTPHLPEVNKPTPDWLFCPVAVDSFSLPAMATRPMVFGEVKGDQEFESLKW